MSTRRRRLARLEAAAAAAHKLSLLKGGFNTMSSVVIFAKAGRLKLEAWYAHM